MKKYYLFMLDEYIGDLYIDQIHGQENISFEFSDLYLSRKNKLFIDKELYLIKGRQYSEKRIFAFVSDMIPDRFGKMLIDRHELETAEKENRLPNKLSIGDYLVRVNDLSRMGAYRLKESLNGDYIYLSEGAIPQYLYIRQLEQASIKIEDNEENNKDLETLLSPGSSLGGARPKASVYYNEDVYIAKFPSKKDDYDVELLECLTLDIAEACEIDVPKHRVEKYSKYGSTLLIKRFDRQNNKRVHYISGMTAIGATDGESGNYSYIDLVEFIKSNCSNPKANLEELYKRMVLSYFINNTDNHLRNHAFIYNKKGYELSPIFDINPTIFSSDFALNLTNIGNNKEAISKSASLFDLSIEKANEIFEFIKKVVSRNLNEYLEQYPSIKKELLKLKNIFESRQ